MSMNIFKKFSFIFILLIQVLIKGENPDENNYYFQLYSSPNQEKPYLFYSQTNDKLLAINSTEDDNCTII